MKKQNKLTLIPSVGISTARDLNMIGIKDIEDLKDRDPEKLYEKLCKVTGKKQDRCVLYVYRCAVYFADGGKNKEKFKWWSWKDEEKTRKKLKR